MKNKHQNQLGRLRKGITLIEVIIFTVLLSLLITNTINYLYVIYLNNIKLLNEVHEAQKGFIATTAVILLSIGTLVFILSTLGSVTLYADSVERREIRIQKSLNLEACGETLLILAAKDYFLSGDVYLSDFDCTVHK